MAADTVSGGSFDDLPDAELRTVLSVPLALPGPPSSSVGSPPVDGRPTRAAAPRAPAGRHRAPLGPPVRSPAVETARVGLFAAVTVLVLVVVALLAVDHLVR